MDSASHSDVGCRLSALLGSWGIKLMKICDWYNVQNIPKTSVGVTVNQSAKKKIFSSSSYHM
jgi:hypothetical protein